MLVEFFGSDGAYFQKDLIGNDDIRDWNIFGHGWPDKINGITTQEVVNVSPGLNGNPDVMDMQIFALPNDFRDETLTTIRITDNRTTFVHSGILSGITVQSNPIPEPSTLFLFGLGALGFIGYGWRRWKQNNKEK